MDINKDISMYSSISSARYANQSHQNLSNRFSAPPSIALQWPYQTLGDHRHLIHNGSIINHNHSKQELSTRPYLGQSFGLSGFGVQKPYSSSYAQGSYSSCPHTLSTYPLNSSALTPYKTDYNYSTQLISQPYFAQSFDQSFGFSGFGFQQPYSNFSQFPPMPSMVQDIAYETRILFQKKQELQNKVSHALSAINMCGLLDTVYKKVTHQFSEKINPCAVKFDMQKGTWCGSHVNTDIFIDLLRKIFHAAGVEELRVNCFTKEFGFHLDVGSSYCFNSQCDDIYKFEHCGVSCDLTPEQTSMIRDIVIRLGNTINNAKNAGREALKQPMITDLTKRITSSIASQWIDNPNASLFEVDVCDLLVHCKEEHDFIGDVLTRVQNASNQQGFYFKLPERHCFKLHVTASQQALDNMALYLPKPAMPMFGGGFFTMYGGRLLNAGYITPGFNNNECQSEWQPQWPRSICGYTP